MTFVEKLTESPVIAAVRDARQIPGAAGSPAYAVFLLQGQLYTLADHVHALTKANKTVFVHIDLIDGLKSDGAGLEYLKKTTGAHGIISTRAQIIKQARNLGMYTILRTFALDSRSLRAAHKSAQESAPHAVEVLPGCSSTVIRRIREYVDAPLIAGGLIHTKKDIMDVLSAGAIAVSVSDEALWEA